MFKPQQNSVQELLQTQELQHLITVSTGFIDAYIIESYQQAPMLLPQNIVLSALDSPTAVQQVDWHDIQLPVYHIHPPIEQGVALVIEGEEAHQRFALMCQEMPKSIRIRISEVVDDPQNNTDAMVQQLVRIENTLYQVPHLANIQSSLQLAP